MLNSKGFVAAGLALRPRKHVILLLELFFTARFSRVCGPDYLLRCDGEMENEVENKILKSYLTEFLAKTFKLTICFNVCRSFRGCRLLLMLLIIDS